MIPLAVAESALLFFEAVDASLVLYPRYAAAIEELGKLQVDQGLYEQLGQL